MTYIDVISHLPGGPVIRCADGVLVRCLVHADHTPSLHISRGAEGRALWFCHGGCSQDSVGRALAALGLGADSGPILHDHRDERDDRQRTEYARELWSNARCATGTLVEKYLRGRGISITIPPSIRFAPALKHPSGNYFAAMVAAVQGADGKVRAVHRTFLREYNTTVTKAAIEPNKMALGPIRGGAVRLAKAGPELVACEGIETGLSILQAAGLPVWVSLGTSNLSAIDLPPEVFTLILAADGDDAGRRAVQCAARHLRRPGLRIRMVCAPRGTDFNDVLKGASR